MANAFWDKSFTNGYNRAKSKSAPAEANLCQDCQATDSQWHMFLECTEPTIACLRERAFDQATTVLRSPAFLLKFPDWMRRAADRYLNLAFSPLDTEAYRYWVLALNRSCLSAILSTDFAPELSVRDLSLFESLLVTVATPLAEAVITMTAHRGSKWRKTPRRIVEKRPRRPRGTFHVPYDYRPLTQVFTLRPRRKKKPRIQRLYLAKAKTRLQLRLVARRRAISPPDPSLPCMPHPPIDNYSLIMSVDRFAQFLISRTNHSPPQRTSPASGTANPAMTEESPDSSVHSYLPPGKPPD